ncbi:MAG TPA: tRNA (N(6)-L-threonylcarbamoyladenosine(37)-C(2))-methylthiotransferase MtaB, partial [Clostridiaceae bacterium]|nr:tRNA (N(6)-L-threonylcarbamoyladenosine(37)-C(2))-methylthiotransferase MtaB [Clostridiaceae bacterium]
KVNSFETEAMIELFRKAGYEIVDFDEPADIYVINTCTVTSSGDKKSRNMIRRAKRNNANAIIAVTGCYSQVFPEKVMAIPGVDIVIGTDDRKKIIDFVEEYKKNNVKIKHVSDIMKVKKFEELDIDQYRDKTRAFLKIQDGCNRFCSYCMIPYARGPIRSREPENVLNEVEKLSKAGFKEIILSGIHIASYGVDLGNINLVDIIEKIEYIDGIERIRIGSVEPVFFKDNIIERLKKIKKLCRHFHLSLQSGCDATLKRMNRRYTAAQYEDIVEKLRDAFPGVSITTDIITGFPGETDEEFNETYNFLKRLELSKTHVFKYSPRRGTPAAKFKGQVSPEVKEKRSNMLLKLNEINEKKFIDKFIGGTLDVLFEQRVKEDADYLEGYSDNYINIRIKSNDNKLIGNIKKCVLEKSMGEYAIGHLAFYGR